MFLTWFKDIFTDAKFASATMFLAWLTWQTFGCAAVFRQQLMSPSLARPLVIFLLALLIARYPRSVGTVSSLNLM